MDDRFVNQNQGGDNVNKIQQLLTELSEASIGAHNFQKWVDKVMNISQMINVQIDNEKTQYDDAKNEYETLKNEDSTAEAVQREIVPLDLYKAVINCHKRQKNIVSWKFYQAEIFNILIAKLSLALGETQALDIKRDALNEMREMENARNKLFQDTISTRFGDMDTKFVTALKLLQQENSVDRKENTRIIASAMTKQSEILIELIRDLYSQGMQKEIAKDKVEQVRNVRTNTMDELSNKSTPPSMIDELPDLNEIVKKEKPKVTIPEMELDDDIDSDEEKLAPLDDGDEDDFLNDFKKEDKDDNSREAI